ncbi:peptidase S1 [Rhodococcus sp. 15-725-2-2b]|uniref:trypsin-like peptidase domain-containing protein n=1 Tax=Nocardiaceae TaxID=85025 RepID=UPI0009E6C4AF|nr:MULTISPECIES: trypsin-like peptidase domain-containing protein [Rhodococcus]OZC67079.1 peptidase S1 [Rhodococcus sp. 06-470-2]OZC72641.1 peptidase S1 [Rhodococcus sp. 06-469-3-2]OZC76870.1 peptidase S1 [Rhodococcus sp. 06-418-5]OZD48867.1 peptidase S1 [Rhodococcus sp. 06-1477-1A]OZD81452.1 peptidase S1 [Rhodococcus sp. 05-339-2]
MSDDRNESEQSGQGAGGEQHPADRASRGDEQNYSAQQHPTQQHPTQQFPPQQGYPQQYAGYGQGAYQPGYGPYGQQGDPQHTQAHHAQPQHVAPQSDSAPTAVKSRPGRSVLVAGAIALVLVGGGIGGAVGAIATNNANGNGGGVTNSLNSTVTAAQPAANFPDGSIQAVANKVLPSVVQIQVKGSQEEGEGSGVILSSDGLILTNNHVATGAGANGKLTVAFSDGSVADATIVGADSVSDMAVIKAEGKSNLTPIELGSSSNLEVGQQVIAIGSPLGLAGTVTTGIVSSLNRPVSTSGESGNQNSVIDAIQTDAAINPGNSGGALVNTDGQLIGINTAIATLGGSQGSAQSGSIGLGFAIPVDQAKRIADELTTTGKATQAMIGVQVPSQDDANGATVVEVTEGGPAAAAGIPKGAVITKVDDRIVASGDALIAAVRSHAPGDSVTITYTDGGSEKTATVTLGTAEPAAAQPQTQQQEQQLPFQVPSFPGGR